MACLLAPTTTGIFLRGTFLRPRHCLTPPGTTATLQWVRTMVVAAAGWGRVRRRESSILVVNHTTPTVELPPKRAPSPLIPVDPARALLAGDPGRGERRVGVVFAPASLEQPTGPARRPRPGRRRSVARPVARRGTSRTTPSSTLSIPRAPRSVRNAYRTRTPLAPRPSPLAPPPSPLQQWPPEIWRPRPDVAALVFPVPPPARPTTPIDIRTPPCFAPREPATRPPPRVGRISPMSVAMQALLFARSTPFAAVSRLHRPSDALVLTKIAANEFCNGATRRERHLDPPTPPGLWP